MREIILTRHLVLIKIYNPQCIDNLSKTRNIKRMEKNFDLRRSNFFLYVHPI